MSKKAKIYIAVGLTALVPVIGFLDILTGPAPRLRSLYFIALVAAAVFVGLWYGLALSLAAAVADIAVSFEFGLPPTQPLLTGSLLRFLTFAVTVFVVDRLVVQLRTIHELEERRSFDLNIAKQVHESVLRGAPTEFNDLSIGVRLTFAGELGGDYYHFSKVDDKLFFCLGDISGKGVAAALFTSLLHQNVRDAVTNSSDLATIVTDINSRIAEALPSTMFVTLFSGLVDGDDLSYINAGHEPALLYRQELDTVKLLTSVLTFPLGIGGHVAVEPHKLTLLPGDVLLILTDGVTQSPYFREKTFDRLATILREERASDPADIVDLIHNLAVPPEIGSQQSDDATIICLKKTGPGPLPPPG